MFFTHLNIRPKLLLGIGIAGFVSVLFVTLFISLLFKDITQDSLPELQRLHQLEAIAHDLVVEYNEYLLESDEESIGEISELKSGLNIALERYFAKAAREENKAQLLETIQTAINELIQTGTAVVENQHNLIQHFEVIEDREQNFRKLFEQHEQDPHEQEQHYGETQTEHQPELPDDQLLDTVRLLITELHLENLEYSKSRENETLEQIVDIQRELALLLAELSVPGNNISRHGVLMSTIVELGSEFMQIFERMLIIQTQLVDKREWLKQASDSLSMVIAEAIRMTSQETNQLLVDSLAKILILAILMPVFLGGTMWLIISKAIKPLFALGDGAKSIGQGEFSVRIKVETKDEFGDLANSFNKMAENLQDSVSRQYRLERLSALGQIAGTISHELRNPLGTIRTSVFNLKDRMRNEKITWADKMLTRIDRNIARCDNIIGSLLDFVRQRPLASEPTEIDLWLNEVLDEQTVPLGITVKRQFNCDTSMAIDRELLRRAITNVYDNACQAMAEANSVNLEQPEGEKLLTCSTSLEQGKLLIVFEDSGSGISAEIIENIFEPLFSTKTFGVGLGMSVVKQVLEQHKGGVQIESEPGSGTRVKLWLPHQHGLKGSIL